MVLCYPNPSSLTTRVARTRPWARFYDGMKEKSILFYGATKWRNFLAGVAIHQPPRTEAIWVYVLIVYSPVKRRSVIYDIVS